MAACAPPQVKRELELCRFCIAEIDRNFRLVERHDLPRAWPDCRSCAGMRTGRRALQRTQAANVHARCSAGQRDAKAAEADWSAAVTESTSRRDPDVVARRTMVAAMNLKISVACSELHDVRRIRALGSKLVRRLLNRASNKFTSRRMSYLLLRDSVNERSAAWRGQTLNYA